MQTVGSVFDLLRVGYIVDALLRRFETESSEPALKDTLQEEVSSGNSAVGAVAPGEARTSKNSDLGERSSGDEGGCDSQTLRVAGQDRDARES